MRERTYLYGGISLYILSALAWLGTVPAGLTNTVIATLILVVLWAGYPDVHAKATGNKEIQAEEKQAWAVATAPIRDGYQRVRRVFRSERPSILREMGAIGADLVAHAHKQQAAGRQSGGRRINGSGGHKKPASSSGDDSDGGDGEPPASIPLICTVHDVAALLQVSAKTLQNQPKSALPPAVHIPGCRGPRYRLRDVIAWLESFPTGQRAAKAPPRKVSGRPRIASATQIAAVRGKGV